LGFSDTETSGQERASVMFSLRVVSGGSDLEHGAKWVERTGGQTLLEVRVEDHHSIGVSTHVWSSSKECDREF